MSRAPAKTLLALLVLPLLACATGPATDLESLAGDWQVREVYCRSCASVTRTDIGTVVHIRHDAIDNPLAGGRCPGRVAFRPVPATPALRGESLAKLDPRWVGDQGAAVRWLAVTCDNLDFTRLIRLPDGSLAYTDDGELAYRLARQR